MPDMAVTLLIPHRYFLHYLPANRKKFDAIMDNMVELAEELRAENPKLARPERLKSVYAIFDIDNNGTVSWRFTLAGSCQA